MKEKNLDTLLSTIENKLNSNYANINNLFKSQNNYYTLPKKYTFDSISNDYKQKETNTYFNYKNENDMSVLKSKSNYNPPYYSFSQISRNYNNSEINKKNKSDESKKENSCSDIIYDEKKYIKEINNIKIRNKACYNYNNKENTKYNNYNNYFKEKKVEEEKDDYLNLKLGKNKIKNQYNSKTNSFNYISNYNLSNLYNNHNYFLRYYKNENIKDSSINGSETYKTIENKEYDKYTKNDNIHNINFNNINIGINNNFIIESEVSKDNHIYNSPFLSKDINRNPNKIKNENSFNRNKFYNPKYFYNTEGNNNYNNTNKINNYLFTNYVSYKNKTKYKSFSSENNKYDNNDFIDIKNYNSLNNSSKDKIIYIKKYGKRGKNKHSFETNKLNLNGLSNNSNSKNGNNNNEYISNIQGNNNIKENGINGNNINSKINFEIIKSRATDLLDVYTNLLYNKILNQTNIC